MNTTNIAKMFRKVNKPAAQRRVWSIPLDDVLIPFFHATNVHGNTSISPESLGAPLRLGRDKNDGSILFSKSGKPVVRVVKEISDHVTMMRNCYINELVEFAAHTAAEKKTEYEKSVAAALKVGTPIREKDTLDRMEAEERMEAEAAALAAALKAEAPADAERELVPA